MQTPNDRIDELIQLWQRAFGELITRDEAPSRARQFLKIYRMLCEDQSHVTEEPWPPEGLEKGGKGNNLDVGL